MDWKSNILDCLLYIWNPLYFREIAKDSVYNANNPNPYCFRLKKISQEGKYYFKMFNTVNGSNIIVVNWLF